MQREQDVLHEILDVLRVQEAALAAHEVTQLRRDVLKQSNVRAGVAGLRCLHQRLAGPIALHRGSVYVRNVSRVVHVVVN
jgi:hypothetical protein